MSEPSNDTASRSRVLTLVFTDLADSTALKTERGDVAVGDLIARHRDHVTRLAEECAGRVIDWAGDGCFLTFETSSAGVMFALRLQEIHAIDADLPGVRMGIHMSEVTEKTGPADMPRVEGLAVDIAARISGLAKPGQVLMSGAVHDSARQRLRSEAFGRPVLWRSHGAFALKGFDKDLEIGEAALEGLSPFEKPSACEKAWPREDGQPHDDTTSMAAERVIRKIAVLPFHNMSSDPDQVYFVDGMTEALIAELAKVKSIKVISRSSVMQYKDTAKPAPEIARELSVDALVEGSIMKAGNDVRITAQLIDAVTDEHLWADSYTSTLENVFKLQAEVALAITDEINAAVTTDERTRIDSAKKVDPKAYELYVRGRHFWSLRSRWGIKTARRMFEEALEIDPKLVLAHVGLADAFIVEGDYGVVHQADAYVRARSEVGRALALDPLLGEAHITRAQIRYNFDWDWKAADEDFRTGIELSPGYATGHHWYSIFLRSQAKFQASLESMTRAYELDPVSPVLGRCVAKALLEAGKADQAATQISKVMDLYPEDPYSRYVASQIYESLGRTNDAVAEARCAVALGGDDSDLRLELSRMLADDGRAVEATSILNSVLEEVDSTLIGGGLVAACYVALKEFDAAFNWLERAYLQQDVYLTYAPATPYFEAVHDDPRYQNLLCRINHPLAQQTTH